MTVLVYKATNAINGKFYIGVTNGSVAKRRREHFHAARAGSHTKFHRAIRKHGEANFSFEVIDTKAEYAEALSREIELIAKMAPSYNITKGGQGVLGLRIPPETLARMAEQRRGSVGYWRGKKRPDVAEAMRARLKEKPMRYWLGKTRSEATKQKISTSKRGCPRPPLPESVVDIFRENMRRAAKARRKPVVCLTDGKTFESAAAASAAYGFSSATVAAVCAGRRNAARGLRFAYMESAA